MHSTKSRKRGRAERECLAEAARRLGLSIPSDWHGVGPVWPLLEQIRQEGARVVLKLDGERAKQTYTFLILGGPLIEASIRTDQETVEEAMLDGISRYAARFWSIPLSK
jgi:hypothetical protein